VSNRASVAVSRVAITERPTQRRSLVPCDVWPVDGALEADAFVAVAAGAFVPCGHDTVVASPISTMRSPRIMRSRLSIARMIG
jgi:hypothetical protein